MDTPLMATSLVSASLVSASLVSAPPISFLFLFIRNITVVIAGFGVFPFSVVWVAGLYYDPE